MQTHRAPTSPEHMDVLQEHQSDQEAGVAPPSNNGAQSELSHDESVSSVSDDEAHADRAVTSSCGGVSDVPESECGHEVNPGTDDQSMPWTVTAARIQPNFLTPLFSPTPLVFHTEKELLLVPNQNSCCC
jgi:hypothetical protein